VRIWWRVDLRHPDANQPLQQRSLETFFQAEHSPPGAARIAMFFHQVRASAVFPCEGPRRQKFSSSEGVQTPGLEACQLHVSVGIR